jgi:hypothetical protein
MLQHVMLVPVIYAVETKGCEHMQDIAKKKKINDCNLQQWAFYIIKHIQSWIKIVNLKRNYNGSQNVPFDDCPHI